MERYSIFNCYLERMCGFTEREVFTWGPEAFVEGAVLSVTAREVIVFTLLFPSNFNSKMVSLLILVITIKNIKCSFLGDSSSQIQQHLKG